MTKKRSPSSKRSSSKKQSSGNSLRGVLLILVLIGVLYVGNRLGLINVDVQEFLDEVLSGELGQDAEADVSSPGGSQPVPTSAPVAIEPVEGEWYRLYFTTPRYPDEPANRTETIVQGLLGVINSAQKTLDIAIYELNLDEIGDAILAARDRGVQVRMVTDTDELEELDALIRLEEAGIPIVGDERNPIMHNKFVVVDGQAVWTGSWNFTANDTYRNNNHGIYLRSPALAQNYTAEFEEMFIDHAFGPTSPVNTPHPRVIIDNTLIETCFAPEDKCADKIINLMRQARQRIDFMAFSFTHIGLGKVIKDRAKDGVVVRGIFEARGSETEHSEFDGMKRQKLDVLQDGNPYTLHHKVFIVDGGTVVLGSFNFSDNADTANDENMLIIHNAELAQQFLAELDRVYNSALNPPNQ